MATADSEVQQEDTWLDHTHLKIPVILGWGLPVVIFIQDKGEAGAGIREWHCKL